MMVLPRDLYYEVIAHAQREAPAECCGVISGAYDGVATRVLPARNVAPNPEYAYLMHSADQWTLTAEMAEASEIILAIYHSHPHSAAYPSPSDIALAAYPDVVYLIVGLTMDPPEVNAYYIRGGIVTLADVELPERRAHRRVYDWADHLSDDRRVT